jgi:S1-C subfamily serine protease
MDRIEDRLPDALKGVRVTNVQSGSWAQLGGLQAGAIILSVNGRDVHRVADFKKAMADVEDKKRDSIVFFVRKGATTGYVELRPDGSR